MQQRVDQAETDKAMDDSFMVSEDDMMSKDEPSTYSQALSSSSGTIEE